MKTLTTLLFALFATTATASDFYIDWQAAWSPPGGDIIAGNKIGRYVIEATPTYSHGFVTASVNLKAYGVRDWVPKEVRGSGLEKFKGSYAWEAEEWRYVVTPRLELGNEKVHFFIENYAPVDRHGVWNEDGVQGQETEYYWLLGVSGRFRF